MNVQTIGRTSYLIIVSSDELKRNHLTADTMSEAEAGLLCGQALELRGGRAMMELYPGRDEVMIFIRTGEGKTASFAFGELEDVLKAVSFCGSLYGSELIFSGGEYILTLTPWDGETIPPEITEFGRQITADPDMLAFLREHGSVIIGEDAAEKLKTVFKLLK